MDLVKNSPKDVYDTIQQTFLAVLNKMDAILNMEQQGSQVGDYSQHNDFKSLLCAALQVQSFKIILILTNFLTNFRGSKLNFILKTSKGLQ